MNKYATLTPDVLNIVKNKHTERPFSGKYHDTLQQGTYLCRGCGAALFRGDSQFHSGCGWPSFDDQVSGAVTQRADADGRRTEIICAHCDAHLGHVFSGEQFTAKNIRHCVNSLAIEFVPNTTVLKTEEAIVAGGCFWGVQYLFQQLPGVLLTEVGYTDGSCANPSYQQVCSHHTGHVEAIRIIFDSEKTSYQKIIHYFFEIHNPSQIDGQGPDLGSQYLSRIFYLNETQRSIAQEAKELLVSRGHSASTEIKPATIFWPAEEYHQNYYLKNNQTPYCHHYTKRF